ncbi:MAG: hypothetical protein M0P94_04625, partial [Candidatus Absconditabacterales bacterium]|nr:hypothetical protein [Candidatus Absconditabacterales bacterium]
YKNKYPDKELPENISVSGRFHRLNRDRPLLILYFLNCFSDSEKKNKINNEPILGIGLSFPGNFSDHKNKYFIKYKVTKDYYNKYLKNEFEEDDLGKIHGKIYQNRQAILLLEELMPDIKGIFSGGKT